VEDIEQRLQELERAGEVVFGDAGRGPETSRLTSAYEGVAERLAPTLRSRLERMLDRASPAGRLYGAMLLNRLDPEAAEDAWDRLSSDESIVEASHGYLRTRTKVAELAAALRAASPEMAFTEEEYKTHQPEITRA
jgi:hypothetical protein